jgi:hypothetical protein
MFSSGQSHLEVGERTCGGFLRRADARCSGNGWCEIDHPREIGRDRRGFDPPENLLPQNRSQDARNVDFHPELSRLGG